MNKQLFYIKGYRNNKDIIILKKVGFNYYITVSIDSLKAWPIKDIIKLGKSHIKCQQLINKFNNRFYFIRNDADFTIISSEELLNLLDQYKKIS